jgi:hypothetical protein
MKNLTCNSLCGNGYTLKSGTTTRSKSDYAHAGFSGASKMTCADMESAATGVGFQTPDDWDCADIYTYTTNDTWSVSDPSGFGTPCCVLGTGSSSNQSNGSEGTAGATTPAPAGAAGASEDAGVQTQVSSILAACLLIVLAK